MSQWINDPLGQDCCFLRCHPIYRHTPISYHVLTYAIAFTGESRRALLTGRACVLPALASPFHSNPYVRNPTACGSLCAVFVCTTLVHRFGYSIMLHHITVCGVCQQVFLRNAYPSSVPPHSITAKPLRVKGCSACGAIFSHPVAGLALMNTRSRLSGAGVISRG